MPHSLNGRPGCCYKVNEQASMGLEPCKGKDTIAAAVLTFWTTASPTASAALTSAGPMVLNCLKLDSAIAPAKQTEQLKCVTSMFHTRFCTSARSLCSTAGLQCSGRLTAHPWSITICKSKHTINTQYWFVYQGMCNWLMLQHERCHTQLLHWRPTECQPSRRHKPTCNHREQKHYRKLHF